MSILPVQKKRVRDRFLRGGLFCKQMPAFCTLTQIIENCFRFRGMSGKSIYSTMDTASPFTIFPGVTTRQKSPSFGSSEVPKVFVTMLGWSGLPI